MASRFEETLHELLRPGKAERFELPEPFVPRLAETLESVATGPDARAEITRALQLMVAMRSTLDSPDVAATLAEILAASPAARPHLEALSPKGGFEVEARRFARLEGRDAAVRAPSVPRPGEQRGLQVKDLLPPGGGDPSRRR